MKRLLISAGLLVLFLSVSAEVSEDARERGAEMIRDSQKYEIFADGHLEHSITRKLTVYNSEGDEYAMLTVEESSFSQLKNFSAKVFNTAGEELESFGKQDGHRACGFSGIAFYQDVCNNFFDLRARTYPYTVEYKYRVDYSSTGFPPIWRPQWPIPVKQSNFTLIVPADFKYIAHVLGDIPEPTVTSEKNREIYEYQLNDIKPFEDEDYVYSMGRYIPSLEIAPLSYNLGDFQFDGSSWNSLAAGCQAMWHGRLELNDDQKTLADSIRREATSNHEICEKLHEALAKTHRYVAIEIGIGGWQPTPASETFDRGYGDCKDLATMYVALLRYAGIEAWPALIQTKGFELTDEEFPSLQFNHVILYAMVDGDTLWMDPTCPFCAVGDLPQVDEDIWVLSLDSANGRLVRTASSTAAQNCIVRSSEVEVLNNRKASVVCRLYAIGNPYQDLKAFLSYGSQDKMEKYLCASDFGLSKKIKPDQIAILNADQPDSLLQVIVRGEMNNAVKSAGAKKYVSFACLDLLRECEREPLKDRTLPLNLSYPLTFVDTISFTIPRKWQVEKLPETVDIENNFGSIHVDYAIIEDKLIVASRRECNVYYVDQGQFPQFSAYLDEAQKAFPEHIAFIAE